MRFITVAIHTYEKALALRNLLESEGIETEFRNVNIENPVISSGVRVRIHEKDLPLALRIIENREIFAEQSVASRQADAHHPVVVPIDFSERSLHAAMAAFYIAEEHKTSIVLLHTYIDPYVAGDLQLTNSLTYEMAESEARVNMEETAKTQMKHFVKQIKDLIKAGTIPAVKFETCVVEGVPEDAITEYTKVNTPFLIVMGTRFSKKKVNDLIGSVTSEVLDKCRFTVLAIPENVLEENQKEIAPRSIHNILFLGNADQEDILAMDTLCRIIPKSNPHITIAHIPGKRHPFMRPVHESLVALEQYCAKNFKNYTFSTTSVSLEKIIDDFAQLGDRSTFDLVVIPNKKKNIFSRLFNPSIAARILFSVDVPMLVIPV